MAKVRIAPAARDDLRETRIYSKAAFGPRVALEYLEGIRATFGLLLDTLGVGSAEPDLGEDIRSFGHRAHRIYYRVDGDGVVIVRILHHARDSRRTLGVAQ